MIFDLDGTVYRGADAIPGAADFIRCLRARGMAIRYVTNRANRPARDVRRQLLEIGLPCDPGDVITAADATAACLEPGRAFVIGEHGLLDALANRGFALDDQHPDYVIVSLDRAFDYQKLTRAVRLILGGAQFVATNPDHALAMEDGVWPGTGSLVAAVSVASGVAPLMIGKPERRLFDAVLADMGLPPDDVIAIGDNLATDIPAGQAAGMRTILMLTGISRRADLAGAAQQPTWVVDSYHDLTSMF